MCKTRQILYIAQGNFRKWHKNPRIILCFLLGFGAGYFDPSAASFFGYAKSFKRSSVLYGEDGPGRVDARTDFIFDLGGVFLYAVHSHGDGIFVGGTGLSGKYVE